MILKLKNINQPINLINWINKYLKNSKLSVRIKGIESSWFLAPSGSHLGPLLFLLFINDIIYVLKYANILLYADDIKLFMTISNEKDLLNFQSDLSNVFRLCVINHLRLNFSKFFKLTFVRIISTLIYEYSLGPNKIVSVSS